MLTCLILISSGSLLFNSTFFFPLLLVIFFFYFLNRFNLFFQQTLSINFFLMDEVSLFIIFITVFVLFVSYIFTPKNFPTQKNITLSSIVLFCILVFSTDSIFLLYLFYEASLLPILFIIIKWGSYPERSLRALILLLYTSVFTFPFLGVMFILYSSNHTFSFTYFSLLLPLVQDSLIFSLVIFLTFAVKLPIYGLHFWLPMAHVEAPTFGSIILAGVLLKLGGVGLIRFSTVYSSLLLNYYMLSYFILFLLFVTVVCAFQSDFKRLVAYSSVSHMITIPFIVLASSSMANKGLIIVMLFHGLSSPVMFMLVGVIYRLFNTRQIVFIRGLIVTRPLLSFVMILTFFFTLSAPPFPSFVGEVLFILSSFYLSYYLLYVFLLFAFLSLVYNLNWLSSILFSSSSPSLHLPALTYRPFVALISSTLISFEFLLLVSFI